MIITIINQHANNLGDEAAAIALIDELESYDNIDKINLIYVGKGILHYNSKKLNHNREINIKNIGIFNIVLRIIFSQISINYRGTTVLNKYLEIIEQSEYIFVSPAGADIGIYKGWASLINLYLVKSCDKKIIFHLNTIGKSNSFVFNMLANRILKKSLIYVRERASLQYLRSIQIQSKFGIDTAFLLRKEDLICTEDNVITLIPTELSSWNKSYRNSNIESKMITQLFIPLCKFALDNNYRIVLLQHLLTEKEKEFYKSLIRIVQPLSYDKIVSIADNINNALDYQRQICQSSIVISMRYHGVVLAAKNTVPFISIAYENKMLEVSSYMGVPYQNIFVDELNKENFIKLVYSTKDNSKKIKKVLSYYNKKLRKLAENPVKENVR